MGGGQEPSSNGPAQQPLNSAFEIKVHPRWTTCHRPTDQHLIAAASKTKAVIPLFIRCNTQQQHSITGLTPSQSDHPVDVLHQTDHADHWSRMDRLKRAVIPTGLVVEGHIATG